VCPYPCRGIVPEKTHQSVSMVNKNVSGLLHGDGVINIQGIILGPFPSAPLKREGLLLEIPFPQQCFYSKHLFFPFDIHFIHCKSPFQVSITLFFILFSHWD
jgi:hypothetical protein